MHKQSVKNGGHTKSQAGVSVLEIILSIAIFGVLAASVLGMVWEPLVTVSAAEQRSQAVLLAEEGLDAVRSIRNDDWLALADGNHGLLQSGGAWQFSGASDVTDIFTRVITVTSVNRDSSSDIVGSGGALDPRTKLVTSTITWDTVLGAGKSLQFTIYLTNWSVYDWLQTDDTDFGGGAVSDTVVSGSGTDALVELVGDSPAEIWTLLDRVEDKKIFTVDGAAEDDVWAGGENGNLYRYDGSSWSKVSSPTGDEVRGIGASATDDVHLVDKDKKAYLWSGTSWSQTGSFSEEPRGVSVVSSSFAVTVGKSGLISHWNGTTWTTMSSPTDKELFAVSMLSETDGFIVGDSGKVLRWNGTAWSEVSFPAGDKLRAVDYYATDLAFAGSEQDKIYRWNGTAWSQESLTTTKKIYAVAVWSATEAWAAGESGTILEWDGSSWTEYSGPTGDHLLAITPRGANGGWIVGEHGRQLRYNSSDQYLSSGTLTSSVLDTDSITSEFGLISWTETLPTGTDITLATRSGNVATPDGSWSAWSAELTENTGATVPSSDARYIQYRASLSTTDTAATPELHDVTVTYSQ